MAITTFTDEHRSPVHPLRIFKASIVDSHNLIPKLMPQAIKSVEIVEGDGGARSIKKINFAEGDNFKSVKYRIDELNEESLMYKYTLIEGDALIDKLEKITYEVKFEQTADGNFMLKEEEVKAGKEKVIGMYKAVEAYLLQNPNAYA
ncbi:hypothetical protein Pfo_012699 [Paulownia fortunei]|nr:hypothetical protein Pfo_012699 [Paulownia fortunei]